MSTSFRKQTVSQKRFVKGASGRVPPRGLMQQLIGMDAKLRQYEQGERFIEAVEASGGPELLAKVWVAPDRLPTLDEIREPADWIARMNSPQLVAG